MRGEYHGSVQIGATVDIILVFAPCGRSNSADPSGDLADEPDDGRRRPSGKGRGGVRVDLRLAFDGVFCALGESALPLLLRMLAELARNRGISGNAFASTLGGRKQTILEELHDLKAENLVDVGTI